jgi:hypothetical protein
MQSSTTRAPARGAAPIALALTLLALAAPLSAQQVGAPTRPPSDTMRVTDPRQAILDRLRRLDARRDTTRDSTAVADSVRRARGSFNLSAPVPRGGQEAGGEGGGAPATLQIQEDSIMKALARLEGFTPTEYAGAKARFAADTGRLVLTGPASVAQSSQAMSADSTLIFNQRTQIACGYGKPVLTGAGQSNPVQSDTVCYDVQKQMGVAFGAKTKFQEGATAWYVNGHKTYLTGAGGQKLFSSDAEFTDCDLVNPHYHFTAKQVKIVGNDVLVARNVVLSFGDVPVFWMPFMMTSLEKGRHSGILMPRFDLNDIARTNSGYNRRIQNVGFYWAVSRNLGALVSMDWFSQNYTAVNGAFDYSFRRQFLQGGLSVKEFLQQGGSRQTTLSANNSWRPDERTNVSLSASYATSSRFVLAQSFDPLELNRSIDSNLGVQRRFNWGSLDFSGSRQQYLQTDRVSLGLPSVGLSVMPITFFRAPSDNAHWFNNIVWSGISANFRQTSDRANDYLLSSNPSTTARTASFGTSLNLGKLSWSQSISYGGNDRLDRPFKAGQVNGRADTVLALPSVGTQNVTWSTSLSIQQRLFGTSSISPQLSISGQSASWDSTVGGTRVQTGLVAAPIRYGFGAGTQMDIYGFWPGVGPFARIRHKLSPSFSYSYSPALDTVKHPLTAAQRQVYTTLGAFPMQSTLNIGLNQTFEAKYRESAKDSAKADSTATADSLSGEPRRLPQARKLTLLAIASGGVVYDFSRDTATGLRRGITTMSINNDIRSDLIPGLQLSISHSLFKCFDTRLPCTGPNRKFSPFLTSAGTSFRLDDRSWIFRMLGLAARLGSHGQAEAQQDTTTSAHPSVADQANNGTGLSMVPGGGQRRYESTSTGRGVGSWNANFTYSLSRERPGASSFGRGSTQMVQSQFSFHPTQSWTVGWRTSYDFTQGDFADHVLSLTRDLHDWEAHFDFVKAQNGNFTVEFHVNLKAQPDLKFDYRQAGGTQPGMNY